MTACLLVGAGCWLAACSHKQELGPVVISPVDKDINGEVISRADPAEDAPPRGSGGAAALFDPGAETAESSGRGAHYWSDGRAEFSEASGGSGGGLFGDDSDGDRSLSRADAVLADVEATTPADAPGAPATVAPDEAGSAVRFKTAPSFDLHDSLSLDEDELSRDRVRAVDLILEAEESDAEFDESLSAGTLTAGVLNDWPEPSAYRDFIAKLAGEADNVYQKFNQGRTFELKLLSESGKPLANADVLVEDQLEDRSIMLRTRTDGRAVVSTAWDLLESTEDLLVTVKPIRGGEYTVTIDPDNPVTHTVRVPRTPDSREVEMVQIALVMDCTGSMGDELEYLKIELKSIAEAVAAAYPGVDQRFALVAYRDKDDAYVTRTIDFTHGVNEFIEELGRQRANGGGDEPEAVQRAYAEAAALSWEDGRVARVVVHVADAPPHEEHQTIALREIDTLRSLGVAVYPLASSGANMQAQFTMRTAALLTGSQYLFLTDDSGVGNAHAEPSESKGYAVMPLRSHLLRVIASEIAGEPIEVDEAMVIRRVGATG